MKKTTAKNLMNTLKIVLSKRLSFADAVSIATAVIGYFSLVFVGQDVEAFSIWGLLYKLLVFPIIFIIRSSLSKSYKTMGTVFNDSWSIINEPNITDLEKRIILKTFLESKMEKWFKYWLKFKKIVCNDSDWKKKANQMKEWIKEVYNGELNMYQGTWLILYYIYAILSITGVLEVLAPYDIIICLIFMGVLYIATGDLVGLGTILVHVFNLLAMGKTEDEIRLALIETEKELKAGAHAYYYHTASDTKIEV